MVRVWLTLWLAGVVVAGVASSTVNINDAIDQLIESGKTILHAKGQDVMTIKDIDKTFDKKIWGVPVQGSFVATGGRFENLGSLRRTGDVTMTTQGETLSLDASLGLDVLRVSFADYHFKLLAVDSSGALSAQCSDNSVSAKIRVVYGGPKTCRVYVDSASIDRLGRFKVSMTGPGSLNQMGGLLLNWILNHFNQNIRSVVNARLLDALQSAASKLDICSKIPPPS